MKCKVFSALLAVLLIFGIAACGNRPASEGGTDPFAFTTASSSQESEGTYRIILVDQDSKPVAGATVQFCTDSLCLTGTTDENGIAAFNQPEGVYEVHILEMPEGYKPDDSPYMTPETYSDVTIVVEAN